MFYQSNYSEQGIWVNDESQGKFYTFFKDKNTDTGQKKWYDLLTPSTYNWFWNVYTNYIGLTTLSDEQIVILTLSSPRVVKSAVLALFTIFRCLGRWHIFVKSAETALFTTFYRKSES